jgi:HIRAN domain-containing protein
MIQSLMLFIYWQDTSTRLWHVVGRLTRMNNVYSFVYTRGALVSKRFIPFGRMTDLYQEYQSDELFPLFSNRLLQKSRPEYRQYLVWLAVADHDPDPLMMLARSGGTRVTDNLSMYPAPVPDENGDYHVTFFCHGIRYVLEAVLNRIQQSLPGDRIYPLHDLQNEWDEQALALRTRDPATLIGYCPRYFAKDFRTVISRSDTARFYIKRINHDAPIEYRLLCEFVSEWPEGFTPCTGGEFEPLAKVSSAAF